MPVSPLVEEATRRSALIWVTPDGAPGPRPVWHVWHDGCAYVVVGGLEQSLPGGTDAGRAVVAVRSHERRGGLLVEWLADVGVVPPGSVEWERVVPVLHAARLNAPDGEQQPQRWAQECTVLRLTPTGEQRDLSRAGPGS